MSAVVQKDLTNTKVIVAAIQPIFALPRLDTDTKAHWQKRVSMLEDPPYIGDVQPSVQAYIAKLRVLQALVKEHTVNVVLSLVQATDHNRDVIFDLQGRSVLDEISNWGFSRPSSILFTTEDQWVMVRSARFRVPASSSGLLAQFTEMQGELISLNKPIDEFALKIYGYSDLLVRLSMDLLSGGTALFEAIRKERDRMEQLKRHDFFVETHPVTRGILSPAFIESLMCALRRTERDGTGD